VAGELAALERVLRAGAFTPVEVTVEPAGAEASVDTLGGVRFPTPLVIWLPFGAHEVTAVASDHHGAMRRIAIDSTAPFGLSFHLDPVATDAAGAAEVDFGDEGAVGEMNTADTLPVVERETLLPKRFRGGGTGSEQDLRSSRVAFGAAAGLSRSTLSREGGAARLGIAATALLSYRVRGGVTVQPELGFAMRGEDNAGSSYVMASVLGGYRHRVGKTWLHLGLGPMLGVAVGGADVAPFDAGVAAAAGVLVPAGPGHALLDLRADLGLTTIDDPMSAPGVYNRAVALRLGYLF
ncbi:MAG TPA: hypothetical protein VML75_23710, partial [Kofleriaceae bacterium]|nr:hypothetical protein [Kofleriaceae bacterium]